MLALCARSVVLDHIKDGLFHPDDETYISGRQGAGRAENESIPPSLARWFAPLLSCEVLLMIYACKAAAHV